jgi:hypothetical protein
LHGILALSFSSITNARDAIGRLQDCFTAELIFETFERDPKLKCAVEVENTPFTWDSPLPAEGKEQKGKKERRSTSKLEPVLELKEIRKEVVFNLRTDRL